MKTLIFCLSVLGVASCTSPEPPGLVNAQPYTPLDSVLQDMYHAEKYITTVLLPDLNRGDLATYDTSGHPIIIDQFFDKVESGNYLPMKMKTEQDTVPVYQLLTMASSATDQSSQFIRFLVRQYRLYHQLKGNPLPDFHFTDLNGITYRREDLRDKLVVVKFWFIGCKPCIEEMPALNDLVERYQDRGDMLFLSLANDAAEKLEEFLADTRFDYAVVPDQSAYTMDTLGVNIFPTHMIIDDGIVQEITNNANSLIELLNRRTEHI